VIEHDFGIFDSAWRSTSIRHQLRGLLASAECTSWVNQWSTFAQARS